MSFPQRGEIWWVDFEPSIGTEIKKTRPALVISNDIANQKTTKISLMPMTSKIKTFPFTVTVEPTKENGLKTISLIKIPDICTFDKKRFKEKIGNLSTKILKEVEDKLRLHLNL